MGETGPTKTDHRGRPLAWTLGLLFCLAFWTVVLVFHTEIIHAADAAVRGVVGVLLSIGRWIGSWA
jgi:hypothetical protein